jgi:arsenate reductase-like glutaredoxin family protein
MSANRRFNRQQEKFKQKIHKEFLERTKNMTEDQLRDYVNKKVAKYAYLNEVAVIDDNKLEQLNQEIQEQSIMDEPHKGIDLKNIYGG